RSPGFDHDDGLFSSGDNKVKPRIANFVVGWVHDVAAVNEADANAGDWIQERNVRKVKCAGSAGDGYNVRVIVRVGRNHGRNNLGFVLVAFCKQRSARTID